MKRKGFTLTEMLVVVVILGIVSGMSVPLIRNLSTEAVLKTFVTTHFWPGVNLHITGPDLHIYFVTQQEP